jgi:hypothetical protein
MIADALSRHDMEASSKVMFILTPSFQLFDDLCTEHKEDSMLWSTVEAGDRGEAWCIIDGIIMVCGRPFIAVTSPLL